jgi:O-antigen ligase
LAFFSLLTYIAVLFIRPQEWMGQLMGVTLLDYVTGVAILATLLVLPQLEWRFKSAPENGLMLGFFAAMLAGHVADRFNWMLFKRTFSDFGKIVLLYFLIVILTNSVGRVKAIVRVMLAGCLFMALHAIRQILTGSGFGGFGPFIDKQTLEVRAEAFGFFNDPNDLALILVTILPFLILGALDKRRNGGARLLRALTIAPILTAIYMTNSRGGWLSLATMLTALMVLKLRSKKIALAIAGMMVVGLFAAGPSRIATINTEEGSAHNRMVLWANGNTMLKQHPLFGVGKGEFEEHSENSQVAHNSFVHCYAELGLVGYFFWIGLFVAALKDAWALHKADPVNDTAEDLSILATAALAAMAGYLSCGVFLSRTYIPPPYILVALIAAMRVIHTRQIGPLPRAFETRDYRYVVLVMFASIPLLWIFLRTIL